MATYYVKQTGDDSTGDGSEGNPFRTPGRAGAEATAAGDIIAIKGPGTYTQSNTSGNSPGGYCRPTGAGVHIVGYENTVFDEGEKPIILATAGSTNACISLTGASGVRLSNVEMVMDTGTASNCRCVLMATGSYIDNCIFNHVSSGSDSRAVAPASGSANAIVARSIILGGFAAGVADVVFGWNNFISGPGIGVRMSGSANFSFQGNIIRDVNTGFDALMSQGKWLLENNIVCNATSSGYAYNTITNAGMFCLVNNCGAVNCGGYGAESNDGAPWNVLRSFYGFGNTSGRKSGFSNDVNPIALTANPFTDPDNNDFSLNDVAGGGAVLRAQSELLYGSATNIYPFRNWLADLGGGDVIQRIRQGNLIGRSF